MKRVLSSLLLALAVAAPIVACGSDDDTATPAAFQSNGTTYCAWVNTPHECDNSGLPVAPAAMPMVQPVQTDPNYHLLEDLFIYHMMYHAFFSSPMYYDSYIGPAWSRYPHQTNIVQINKTTYIHQSGTFDRTYKSQESGLASGAKYKTPSGKTYNGKTVPAKSFSGGSGKNGTSSTGSGVKGSFGSSGSSGSKGSSSGRSSGSGFSGGSGRSSGGSRGR